ncbi:4228_t:CDS:2 [Funneliformis caledonium]|uniref:4228_t:CDS:1 n=1 Tax=Funneliformis caledonium TaxID=1117310 RepID=A0A9N9CP84_9GLOM|nr:4228_t:CDS:2 [Funneliformis caledonium]
MEVDQISDTTHLPLDKGKNKKTVTVTETTTNNKKDEMNVNGPSDVSENTINTTLVADIKDNNTFADAASSFSSNVRRPQIQNK